MGATSSKKKSKAATAAAAARQATSANRPAKSVAANRVSSQTNASPEPTNARPRPTSGNPRFVALSARAGRVEPVVGGKVFVCSVSSGDADSSTAILRRELPKPAYNVDLVDSIEACTHMILVASVKFYEDSAVVANLNKAQSLGKVLLIMYELPGAPGGGDFVEITEGMPTKFDTLKSGEWVGLHRDGFFMPASLLTVLRQAGLAKGQKEEDEQFDFFLSHKQTTSQGTCMTMYQILQDRFEFKVWLDMMACDLSTQGMMKGVQDSANFLLFVGSDTFESYYCMMELTQAIALKKRIVVVYEERTNHNGLPLNELLARVPDAYKFLRTGEAPPNVAPEIQVAQPGPLLEKPNDINIKKAQEAYGWLPYKLRDQFQQAILARLLELCELNAPSQKAMALFESVPNCFLRQATPDKLVEEFQPGTRDWMFESVDAWRKDLNGSQMYALIGQGGVGKSSFAAELVRRGNTEITGGGTEGEHVVAYHFFHHKNQNSVRNCLLSISAQLRKNVKGFREAFDLKVTDSTDTSKWSMEQYFFNLIAEPASAMQAEHHPRVLVVVDALDECKESLVIANILRRDWMKQSPKWLTVLFTTRPSVIAFPSTPEQAAAQGITMLNTENESNMDDVRLYLQERVFKHRVHPDQLYAFVQEVAKKSQGLFLYLRFLDEVITNILRSRKLKTLTMKDLKNFPSGLGGVYEDYFGRLFDELKEERYGMFLGTVLAAREPVPKEVWMRACGVSGNLRKKARTDKSFKAFVQAEKLCRNLLHVPTKVDHSQSEGVRFVHKSMVDWLTAGWDEEGALRANLEHLHVGEDMTHPMLAGHCLDAFKLGTKASMTVQGFAARHSFFHLCEAERFEEAKEQLFDFNLLLYRLEHDTTFNLDADVMNSYDVIDNDDSEAKQDATVVAKVLRLGFAALARDRRELAGQILGRLAADDVAHSTALVELREQAFDYQPGVPWWRPVNACLTSAASGDLLRILNGHTWNVSSVAVSPDGNTIASGSFDQTIRLFDARNGETKLGGKAITGHTNRVRAIAYSPDGKSVVSGSHDNTIRLWDTASGEGLWGGKALKGHTDEVTTVAFSPDGSIIASGSTGTDVTLRLWDAKTGEPLLGGKPLEGHRPHTDVSYFSFTTKLAFSPDGLTLASGSLDKIVRLWNVKTGKQKFLGGATAEDDIETEGPFRGHTQAICALAYSPDGRTIVSGATDSEIRVWDASNGKLKMALVGHIKAVLALVFSPDGTTIASGSDDKTIRLWDSKTGMGKGVKEGHARGVRALAYSSDGTRLVSGSDDMSVRVWDVSSSANKANVNKPFAGHRNRVRDVRFSHNGKLIVSACFDRTVRIFDAKTGMCKVEMNGHSLQVQCAVFSPDGKIVASGASDNKIYTWRAKTGQLIPLGDRSHKKDVRSLVFSPDGKTLASGGDDAVINIWMALAKGSPKATLVGHQRCVNSIVYSKDGSRLVSASSDSSVRLWDVEQAKVIHVFNGHSRWAWCAIFSPDEKTIVSCADDATIRLWNSENGESVKTIEGVHTGSIKHLAFSPDGNSLASCSHDRTVCLTDTKTWEVRHTMAGHSMEVYKLSFSPDGKRLASCSQDKSIVMWDANKGSPLLGGKPKFTHTAEISGLAYSPDGDTLVSASRDNTMYLWDSHTAEALQHGKPVVGHTQGIQCVAYSPTGEYIVSGGWDRTMKVWDAKTRELKHTLNFHVDCVRTLLFSVDGKVVRSEDANAKVFWWSPFTGAECDPRQDSEMYVVPTLCPNSFGLERFLAHVPPSVVLGSSGVAFSFDSSPGANVLCQSTDGSGACLGGAVLRERDIAMLELVSAD